MDQARSGTSPGLLLTGSIAALVYAYLVRFLAVALQTRRGGARQDHAEHGWRRALPRRGAARDARARARAAPRAAALLAAALLVFVDVMKELPATFVMRPFNFDTLAVQAYNLRADERLAEAATPALTIVVVGLVPLIVLRALASCDARVDRGAVR